MFAVTKIQIFESNSQLNRSPVFLPRRCSPSQRYKFLKAIHNRTVIFTRKSLDVRRHKDTNFWKQFTTLLRYILEEKVMFAVTKIQIFESNSQQGRIILGVIWWCSPSQRYKFLKAIHNLPASTASFNWDVRRHKDTNFWKQFTTEFGFKKRLIEMFAVTKIQIFESNSQRLMQCLSISEGCSPSQRYKFLKAIHNRIVS